MGVYDEWKQPVHIIFGIDNTVLPVKRREGCDKQIARVIFFEIRSEHIAVVQNIPGAFEYLLIDFLQEELLTGVDNFPGMVNQTAPKQFYRKLTFIKTILR
jgi:hypothetical protein